MPGAGAKVEAARIYAETISGRRRQSRHRDLKPLDVLFAEWLAQIESVRSLPSTTEAEVQPPTKGHQCPTRVRSQSRPAPATARVPEEDGSPSPQAKARDPAVGDSEDLASGHLAPFRRQPRCRARCSREAPSEEPAAGTRSVQRGKGVVRFSEGVEIQFGDPNAR